MSAATALSHDLFPLGPDSTPYRKLTSDGVRVEQFGRHEMVVVEPEALRGLAEQAFMDINHLLRPGHLKQLAAILDDPEATSNDRFVAYDLLKNANIAAGGILPMCQDTGTAIVMGKKGRRIWTEGGDEGALAAGIRDAYLKRNLRYSQLAPISMFEEQNTKSNLPAQIELYAEGEDAYKFLFVAKGGGSANKTFLFQGTPSLLTRDRLMAFLKEKILTLGTAACPPYHLAIVIGGTSAEQTLKTVKLASTRYLDALPTQGSEAGHAFRDLEMEAEVHRLTQALGVGAQFGGKYFCHDVRVIRLPRHGASLPIGLGVSCSADRQALGKITRDGIYLEQLEANPAQYLPEVDESSLGGEVVRLDLSRPMSEILATLNQHPIRTRLSLTGPMIVARDIAHAKIRERLERGEPMPDYLRDHPVYYAGPAKTPEGYASGSFGPTTAGRMDSYVDDFQAAGGSMVMLAKGNRSAAVRQACQKHGGFYLGSIGGPAARLAQDCIRKVEVVEYPELGMEAIWRIEVENFPAFIVTDNKGNDFFRELNLGSILLAAACLAAASEGNWIQGSRGMWRQKNHSPLQEGLCELALVGWAAWSFYNLYSFARYDVVFVARKVRYGGAGWLSYSDDPMNFSLHLSLYSLPSLVLILAVLIWALNRRYAGRPAFRRFVDGGGPPPIVRRPDER